MSLLIRKHRKNIEREERERGGNKKKEEIELNSKKIICKMEEGEVNIKNEIIYLKFFCKLLDSLYKINLDKESFEGLDDEYKKILIRRHYQTIINLFNETRDLIFYLLFCRVFVYNGNIQLF